MVLAEEALPARQPRRDALDEPPPQSARRPGVNLSWFPGRDARRRGQGMRATGSREPTSCGEVFCSHGL